MANKPKVFFDVTADGSPLGRIVMEVPYDDYLKISVYVFFKKTYIGVFA